MASGGLAAAVILTCVVLVVAAIYNFVVRSRRAQRQATPGPARVANSGPPPYPLSDAQPQNLERSAFLRWEDVPDDVLPLPAPTLQPPDTSSMDVHHMGAIEDPGTVPVLRNATASTDALPSYSDVRAERQLAHAATRPPEYSRV